MLALLAIASGLGAAPRDDALLIRGARVFDGTGKPATIGDVLIRDDRIVAVGARVRAPRGARMIDARGLTLLPGLHDLHTHLRAPAFGAPDDLGKAYAAYLRDGVTNVNDFSVSGEMLEPIRAMTRSGAVPAPHLSLAIRIGVPGGHGTEYGWGDAFTLPATTPRSARLAVRQALAYRPDVIKVFADGWRYGRSPGLNDMNLSTLRTIVVEAHAANVPVITHTVTLAGAKIAASAGVDAVGHGVGDAPVDGELIALMQRNGTAYVPTMVVYEPQQDRAFPPREWRRMRGAERTRELRRMNAPIAAIPALEAKRWAILQDNVRRLHAAGVRFGIGTDAGIGGVYHGSSTLREIRLLAALGLGSAQALTAATGGSAAILRRPDHGRIAIGQRADFVLTGGRPDIAIDDLYDIRRVFAAGREVPLPKLLRSLDRDTPTPLPTVRMRGPIDTGVRGDGRTDLGTLLAETGDAGTDNSRLTYVRAADGGLVLGARFGAGARPYAQLVVPLTKGAVLPADARGFLGIAFTAQGSGRMLIDSYGLRADEGFSAPFAAPGTEVRLPFAAFRSAQPDARLDPASLRALIVRLEGAPGGRASLTVSRLHFYR